MKRDKARKRQAAYLQRETPEEREARLQKARDYKQAMKNKKSQQVLDAEREARREYERNRKRDQRARAPRETYQQKEVRLLKRREDKALSLPDEPPEPKNDPRKGAHKLEYNKNRNKAVRANETPQEREARLEKMRQYSAERRANKEMKTSAKVKDATNKRVAEFRSKRTPEQLQQDRQAAKEGMANLKERRSNNLEEKPDEAYDSRTRDYHLKCNVRKWRLEVAKKGADAGPEPLLYNGEPEYCHRCDQDLKVPLAGKGRCPCHECAKLFNKYNEYIKRTNVLLN